MTGEQTVLAATLGNLTNSYLIAYNVRAAQTGEFEVELI